MKNSVLMVLAGLAPMAIAQAQVLQSEPAKPAGPLPVQPAVQQAPEFEPLAKKGPDGKVIRLEGVVDIQAFKNNKLMDDATRERVKPAILLWLADVDQLAIDNLDFMEKIESADGKPAMLDHIDVDDHVQLQQMSQMMSQLMSAGPLSNHLETKGVLTHEQSVLNQRITSDYLQQCMNEIMGDFPDPEPLDESKMNDAEKAERAKKVETQKKAKINALTKFLYGLSCKDSISSYHRLMADAAPNIDTIVSGLSLKGEQASKVQQQIPSVKAAKTKTEQKAAVRKLMNELNFDQRRELLTKAQELAPVKDPLVTTGW